MRWLLGIGFGIGLCMPVFGQLTRAEAEAYEQQGLHEKALKAYSELVARDPSDKRSHAAYVDLLLALRRYGAVRQYLRKRLRQAPTAWDMHVDMLRGFYSAGQVADAERYFVDCFRLMQKTPHAAHSFGYYLSQHRFYEYAIQVYEWASTQGALDTYALSLANLYFVVGNKRQALLQCLSYVVAQPQQRSYVLQWLQGHFGQAGDQVLVNGALRSQVRAQPTQTPLGKLWLDWHLGRGAYAEAYAAATYLDKLQPLGPYSFLQIGERALAAEAYADALTFFTYVQRHYAQDVRAMQQARYGVLATREAQLKASTAMNEHQVDSLIGLYARFVAGAHEAPVTQRRALHRMAVLYMTYAQRPDTAVQILSSLTKIPNIPSEEVATYRLDLADAYLFSKAPWEAILLYAQVERTAKYARAGEEAKWRRALAYYYQGDFRLARAQLDVLEQSTTKLIANDALALSYLIKLGMDPADSMGVMLKALAQVDRILRLRQWEKAYAQLERMRAQAQVKAPALVPYIYMRLANIAEAKGQYQNALQHYARAQQYPQPIQDKACFRGAEIYHYRLKDKLKAIQKYRELLSQYPESIHRSTARRRWEKLAQPQREPIVAP